MNDITGCARPLSAVATWTCPSWNSSWARSRRENRAALDADAVDAGRRLRRDVVDQLDPMSSPGKKRANRSASRGTTSAAVYTSSSRGSGSARAPPRCRRPA